MIGVGFSHPYQNYPPPPNLQILLVRSLKQEDVSFTHPKHVFIDSYQKSSYISKNQSLNFRGFIVIPVVNLLFRIRGAKFHRKDYDKKLYDLLFCYLCIMTGFTHFLLRPKSKYCVTLS